MRARDVEPKVEALLFDSQELRDSSKKLLLKYWEEHDEFFLTDQQRMRFMAATPAESILRAKRTLNPKYPPSKETIEANYGRFIEELDDHGEKVMRYYA